MRLLHMNNRRRFMIIALTFMLVGLTVFSNPTIVTVQKTSLINKSRTNAGLQFSVIVHSANYDGDMDDDDFYFKVMNGTQPLYNANVTIQYLNGTNYSWQPTPVTGIVIFYDVPQETYRYLIYFENTLYANDTITSDGPHYSVHLKVGNIDWQDNNDDALYTVLDEAQRPVSGLNITIFDNTTDAVVASSLTNSSGIAYFENLADGAYKWNATIPVNTYAGTQQANGTFVADGTKQLVRLSIARYAGNYDLLDFEFFVYYESSLHSISGATITITYKNGTAYKTNTTNSNGIALFIDPPRTFLNWTATVSSTDIATGYVNLTDSKYDFEPPQIESVGNYSYVYESANQTLSWNVTDAFPDQYLVFLGKDLVASGNWNNTTPITVNITGLDIGYHQYMLYVNDTNGNSATDNVTVFVHTNDIPNITGPEDFSFTYGNLSAKIVWNTNGTYKAKFNITRNGTVIASGAWNFEKYELPLNDLKVGVYEFVLSVNDTSYHSVSDKVIVTVLPDTVSPTITHANDVTYARGTINNYITWNVSDDYPGLYNVTIDGKMWVNGTWTSGQLRVNIDGLGEGVHTLVIRIYDRYGNYAEDTVQITVTVNKYVQTQDKILMLIGAVFAIFAVYIIWKKKME